MNNFQIVVNNDKTRSKTLKYYEFQ